MNDRFIQETVLYWGTQNLTRWPELGVRDVNMPAASKTFLIDIGLPSPGRDVCGWSFEWELGLPHLHKRSNLRLLGRNRGFNPFLIDEGRDGAIICRAADDGFERYINASVEQFGASLVEMDRFSQETLRTIDEPYDIPLFTRRIADLEYNLKAIDATAFASKDSMWRSDIFGMRLELK